jgi:hypothetical protein
MRAATPSRAKLATWWRDQTRTVRPARSARLATGAAAKRPGERAQRRDLEAGQHAAIGVVDQRLDAPMLRRLGQHALDVAEREVGGVAVEIFGIERTDRRLSRRHRAQQVGVGDAAAAERHDGEAELAAAVGGDAVGEALHGAPLGPRRPEAGMHRPDGHLVPKSRSPASPRPGTM